MEGCICTQAIYELGVRYKTWDYGDDSHCWAKDERKHSVAMFWCKVA